MGEDSGIEDGEATTTRRRRDVFAAGGGFTDRATWRRRQTGAGEPVNLGFTGFTGGGGDEHACTTTTHVFAVGGGFTD